MSWALNSFFRIFWASWFLASSRSSLQILGPFIGWGIYHSFVMGLGTCRFLPDDLRVVPVLACLYLPKFTLWNIIKQGPVPPFFLQLYSDQVVHLPSWSILSNLLTKRIAPLWCLCKLALSWDWPFTQQKQWFLYIYSLLSHTLTNTCPITV